MSNPILYSFRRCPYAMRARMSLLNSNIQVELREVLLKDKPQAMLDASPKGTVPVLVTTDGVLDESLDIMLWALERNDPGQWILPGSNGDACRLLIELNDGEFKKHLDGYKYTHPDQKDVLLAHRQAAETFLAALEDRLTQNNYLFGDTPCLADIAILPFVRQFANVDLKWFNSTPYVHLQNWLKTGLEQPLFQDVMQKHPPWQPGDAPIEFPSTTIL